MVRNIGRGDRERDELLGIPSAFLKDLVEYAAVDFPITRGTILGVFRIFRLRCYICGALLKNRKKRIRGTMYCLPGTSRPGGPGHSSHIGSRRSRHSSQRKGRERIETSSDLSAGTLPPREETRDIEDKEEGRFSGEGSVESSGCVGSHRAPP